MGLIMVESAIEERLRFIGCDERDGQYAEMVWSLIEPDIEAVIENFYRRLAQTPDAPQIQLERISYLVVAQKDHWKRLLLSCGEDAYVDQARRIGATHRCMQVEPRWYIAGYALIANELIGIVAEKTTGDTQLLAELIRTITRHVALDMEIALTVYYDASEPVSNAANMSSNTSEGLLR